MQDSRAPSSQQPPSPEASKKREEWLPSRLSSQVGLLGTERSLRRKRGAAGSQVRCRFGACTATVSSLPHVSMGYTRRSPAASFPGTAVNISRTVASLGLNDGTGIAQSDTQQVSSSRPL